MNLTSLPFNVVNIKVQITHMACAIYLFDKRALNKDWNFYNAIYFS